MLQRGKGRPRNDERQFVLTHFAHEIAKGRTVSDIAAKGLTLGVMKLDAEGKIFLDCAKRLKGKPLERRYRQYRAEIFESLALATMPVFMERARFLGIRMPKAPLSPFPPVTLKRGRPKK